MDRSYLFSLLTVAFSLNSANADFTARINQYDFHTPIVHITVWTNGPYQNAGDPVLYGLTVSPEIEFPVGNPAGRPRLNVYTAKGNRIIVDRRMSVTSGVACGLEILAAAR